MRAHLILSLTALLALALPCAASQAAGAPQTVAYFGVLFLNTSPESTTPDEERRLAAMDRRLREALADSGRYDFVDTAPVAEEAARYGNLAHCNGCDARLAARLGADLALTGEVQKTSNLILHISVYLRDAETGALVDGGSADIRGNTDESWARGIDYLLRNRLLED
jgi:hypothetical protein